MNGFIPLICYYNKPMDSFVPWTRSSDKPVNKFMTIINHCNEVVNPKVSHGKDKKSESIRVYIEILVRVAG